MSFDIDKLELSDTQKEAISKEFETRNESVRSVNSALKTEKTEALEKLKEAEKSLTTMKDQGETVKQYKERIAELESEGGFDKEKFEKDLRGSISGEFSEQIETLSSQNEALTNENNGLSDVAQLAKNALSVNVRESGIKSAMIKTKADPLQEKSLMALSRDTVMVTKEDGERVMKPIIEIDEAGNPTFRSYEDGRILSDEKGQYNFNDWLEYLEDKKHLKVFKGAVGTSTNGGKIAKTGVYKSTMTAQEKTDYKEVHGYPAYNELPMNPPKEG